MGKRKSQSVRIRRGRDTDLPAIQVLDKQCFGPSCSEVPDPEDIWWVAVDGDQVIGYAGIHLYGATTGFLVRCAVQKQYRGNKLQQRFTSVRERWARKQGLTKLITWTSRYMPLSANNLIDRGFRLYAPEFKWASEDGAIYLRKML